MTDLERQAATAIVAAWERLGRPWVPDMKGSEIGDLPAWLERHPPREWGSVTWALAIWRKQAARGYGTERTWTRSTPIFEDTEATE